MPGQIKYTYSGQFEGEEEEGEEVDEEKKKEEEEKEGDLNSRSYDKF